MASPAGYATVDAPSLPVAATRTAPFDHAYSTASWRSGLKLELENAMRMTFAPPSAAATTPPMMSLSCPTPEASRTWTGMTRTLTPYAVPAMPSSLSAAAAAIVAMAVPCPFGSVVAELPANAE